MGWFRLFDRLRLRPANETLEGWALPGSALRVIDPHLASYFQGLIANSGVLSRVDLYDVTSHMFARTGQAHQTDCGYYFHVDIRAMGPPAPLLLASDQVHAIVTWHAASRVAQVALPGEPAVELRAVDLIPLLRLQLPISDIATLSAWLPDARAIGPLLTALAPFLSFSSTALIRLPGAALPDLMTILPELPVQPVALLPCEPEIDDPSNPLPDVLLCLGGLSAQSFDELSREAQATQRVLQARIWSQGSVLPPDSGLKVSAIADSRAALAGLPISLLGDAPPTLVGASFFAMQRAPSKGLASNGLLFELQAATLGYHDDTLVAIPLVGPAVGDPDVENLPEDTTVSLILTGPMRFVATQPTIFLGQVLSRAHFAAQIWPKLELAYELVDREKIPVTSIALLFEGEVSDWVRDAVVISGLDPSRILTDGDGVLFRRLILASPACHLNELRRGDLFDRFWVRLLGLESESASSSLTQMRSSGRVFLLGRSSRLLNADDLLALARDRQYRVIDPDTASVSTLAAGLRDASVIVAESHAGIWSALAPSAALGLLQSDTDPEIPYAALHAASARGHQLIAMFGSAIGDGPAASYVVASDRFSLMLDRLEEAASPRGRAA